MATPAGRSRAAAARAGAARRRWLLLGAVVPLVASWPGAAATGQEVRFADRPEREEERRLARFLERGRYELWARDTVLGSGESTFGDVLVLEASVRIEGEVRGTVFVVGGDLFLRPGSRIGGDAVVLGGGFYSSQLARVEGRTVYRPNLFLRAVPREGGYEIFRERDDPPVVTLHGLHGFGFPGYQRVDGWTLSWGGTVRPPGIAGRPSLEATVRFRSEQGEPEGTLRALWGPGGGLRIGAVAGRATATEEGWVRGEVANTASFLLGSDDLRNYYRADRAALVLERAAETGWVPSLRVGWEEASSLPARADPLLFAGDEVLRPNPEVDDGTTWSATAAVAYRRGGPKRGLLLSLSAEAADSAVAGDFSFLRGELRLAWRRPLVPVGRLEVIAIARGDLAGRLPRQRWSAVGGGHTLPTLRALSRRGERLLYGQAGLSLPVEPLRVPYLGAPRIVLRGALGAAWSEPRGDLAPGSGGPPEPSFDVNAVLGVRFLAMEALVAVDPGAGDVEPEFVLGAVFPPRFWR